VKKKRGGKMKKMKRMVFVMLAVLLLTPTFFSTAYADDQTGAAKRWNIMLVVDGSGSLFSGPTTDPDGLRYEAIDDLLGILQDNGNNVGAILFSANPTTKDSDEAMRTAIRLNTGMISFDEKAPDGSDPKDYINSQLRNAPMDYGKGGTTDIGTALLVAEETLEELQKQNSLDSVVFLFTDGETELNHSNTYAKSIENMHEAEQRMLENNIKLCGVFLNKNGRSTSTEVVDMVCAANGVANNTLALGDTYIEIEDSTSCHAAMEHFMRLLGFSTSDPIPVPGVVTFRVPGTGAEEANIRIYSTNGETIPKDLSVSITSPSGVKLSGTTAEAICRSGRTFKNYKLVNPESGTWSIKVDTDDTKAVGIVCELVFTMDKKAEMVLIPAAEQLHVNGDLTVEAFLTKDGVRETEPAQYREFTCELVMRNLRTNEETRYTISPDRSNVHKITVPLNTYGAFETYVVFSCDTISAKSDVQVLTLENKPPKINSGMLNIKYSLFGGKIYEYDFAEKISDPEDGDNLQITIESEDCDLGAIKMDGTKMEIRSADIGSGKLKVTVQDSQGAASTTEYLVSTKNITLMLILTVVGVLLLGFVILVLVMRSRPQLNGRCKLTVPCEGIALEIDLPTPGSQGKRKTSLAELVKMEEGDGAAIRNACKDDAMYNKVLDIINAESFDQVKLSIVKGKSIDEAGKKIKIGKLKVRQGRAVDVIFNSSIQLNTNADGFRLAYSCDPDESNEDLRWDGWESDSAADTDWNMSDSEQSSWDDNGNGWN